MRTPLLVIDFVRVHRVPRYEHKSYFFKKYERIIPPHPWKRENTRNNYLTIIALAQTTLPINVLVVVHTDCCHLLPTSP